MSGQVMLKLPGTAPIVLADTVVAQLEAALREYRRRQRGSRDLGSELAAFLRGHPGSSTIEIARHVKARDTDVRFVLRSDPRFNRAVAAANRSTRVRGWILATSACEPVPANGTGTPATGGRVA